VRRGTARWSCGEEARRPSDGELRELHLSGASGAAAGFHGTKLHARHGSPHLGLSPATARVLPQAFASGSGGGKRVAPRGSGVIFLFSVLFFDAKIFTKLFLQFF